jgi:hypothetical protein
VRVLFDHGTPAPLRHELTGHEVKTAYELGWSSLKNGELIAAAEADKYEVLVTTDKNLRYQQNLTGRSLAIVVLWTTSWPKIQLSLARVRTAVDLSAKGSYTELAAEVMPNPSLNRTRYGKRRKPGLRHTVHHLSPGLRRLPSQAG